MTAFITAVYKDGVFKPLEPVVLDENQTVSLLVSTNPRKKTLPPSDFGALRGIWKDYADELEEGLAESRRETAAKLERMLQDLTQDSETPHG